MTINQPEYKNLYDNKVCAYCEINHAKMYKIIFRHRYSARVHAYCIDRLGGFAQAQQWLEDHVVFVNPKEFYFKKEEIDHGR